MQYNTKYEIGQKVWVMHGKDVLAIPFETEIKGIKISQKEDKQIHISYETSNLKDTRGGNWIHNEFHLFPTKKDLLDSL